MRFLPARDLVFSIFLIWTTQSAAQSAETPPDIVVIDNYNRCKFSRLRSWNGEIKRLNEEKNAAERSYNFGMRRLADARADLDKRAYLSSEQINDAISAINIWQPMAERALARYLVSDWCAKCAEKKPDSWQQCK